jgi:signal transduction histidine kinase
MKLNFQQKLVWSFLIIFVVFTAGIAVFQQSHERRNKTEALQAELDAYADMVSQYLIAQGTTAAMDSLMTLMPPNLRLTLVERDGKVVYDNAVSDPATLENHADRPEIADALASGSGTLIRTSTSVNQDYLYYAKDNGNSLIVRVALPHDIVVKSFLKPDNAFLYFVVVLLIVGFVFIYYVSRHFGRSVRYLGNFSSALHNSAGRISTLQFPKNEFGDVARRLADDFDRIREHEKQIAQEREKLLLHIQTSAEGVCFFRADSTVAFYNGLFMQYFNVLTGEAISAGQRLTGDSPDFKQVREFLDQKGGENYYEARIGKHGKDFVMRLNIFEDYSFEIILTDITAHEKNRRLKQEMTGNIAHELRTPVTSIRGFLEILLNNELGKEKEHEYLQRAYSQTKTLSDLISDMSLLTRIDERQNAFEFSDIDINRLLDKVHNDTSAALAEKQIAFDADIPEGLTIEGNESLLYSVFRNLTDNVISHAGTGIAIKVKAESDGSMVRFSFADTGKGISDERHFARLFERFYRVSEGRTRDTGGSGLGLSITKNAVQFHGGTISVRPATPHGLEFIILLPEK